MDIIFENLSKNLYVYIVVSFLISALSIFYLKGREIGKNGNSKSLNNDIYTIKLKFNLKSIPFLLALVLLGIVFILNISYENKLQRSEKLLDELNEEIISLKNKTKYDSQTQDSLQILKRRLYEKLDEIKKIEAVTGKTDLKDIINKQINQINKLSLEINDDLKYNELDKSFVVTRFIPEFTHNIRFECPKTYETDSLELELKFVNEDIIEKIDNITIMMYEIIDNKYGKGSLVFSYKPQRGINRFKIYNYLKARKGNLDIGYFLKSEIKSYSDSKLDAPTFAKIQCSNITSTP